MTRKNPDGTARDPHRGIDIPAPPGSEIKSCDFGTPMKVRTVSKGDREGNYVVLDGKLPDGRKIEAAIMHMEDNVPIKPGDVISPGGLIGFVGKNPGVGSSGPHMHLQIKIDGVFDDPGRFLHDVKNNRSKGKRSDSIAGTRPTR